MKIRVLTDKFVYMYVLHIHVLCIDGLCDVYMYACMCMCICVCVIGYRSSSGVFLTLFSL